MISNDPRRIQPSSNPTPSAPDIAAELKSMATADQAMRKGGTHDRDLDKRHTDRLKAIIDEIGWPTASKVGAESAQWAWLLAQHADHDVDFQAHALTLMKQCAPGEVEACHIALLEDRVLVHQGAPQICGTQGLAMDGVWTPFPIKDPESVDERRKACGLNPLAEYVKFMNEMVVGKLRTA